MAFVPTHLAAPSSSGQNRNTSVVSDKCDSRLYIGNIDQRVTESQVIKMFSPFGKMVSEDFLWHRRGPKQGEPRGYAFIQFSTREEAELAIKNMDGRLVCGRALVVRFAGEKSTVDSSRPSKSSVEVKKSSIFGYSTAHMSRSSAIAAIKSKLKSMGEESCSSVKKPRQG